MEERPKFCSECGQSIKPGASFCSNCGNKINDKMQKSQNIQNKQNHQERKSRKEIDKARSKQRNEKSNRSRVRFSYWLLLTVAMYFFREKLVDIYLLMIPVVIGWIIVGLINPKFVLWWVKPEKKKRLKVIGRGVLLLIILSFMLIMTDKPLTPPAGLEDDSVDIESSISSTYVEEMKPKVVQAQNDIIVAMPPGDLNTDKELKVSESDLKPKKDGVITNVLDSYEITLGDVHQFDGDLVIDIPYDSSKLQSDNPKESLEAVYYNEEKEAWEQLRCKIDNEKITIYMDHLTKIAIVESNRTKMRQPSDFRINEEIIKDVNKLSSMDEKKAMDKLEMLGWSKSMNYFGGLGSSTTFLEHAMKFSKLSGGNDILKYFGASTAVIQVMVEVSDGDYDAATRDGVKGFMNFLVAHKGSSALQLAGVGVFCIDYSLNKFATEAKELRENMLDNIYNKYYATEARRTPTQWYNILWNIVNNSNSQEEIKNSIEQELDNYVTRIWNDEGAVAALQAEMQEHGWTFEAGFTDEQKRKLERQHKVFLVKTLQPVFNTVEKNLRSKIIKENVETKYRAIEYLKSNIPISVKMVGGYPNEKIKAELWTDDAKILESESQTINDPWSSWELAKFDIRLVDYVRLGCPNKIKVIITDENGKTRSKTQDLTFARDMYGLRVYTNFEFDCPKKVEDEDTEYIEDDENIEDDSTNSGNIDDGSNSSGGSSSDSTEGGNGFSDEVNEAFLEYKKVYEYLSSLPDDHPDKRKVKRELEVKYKIYMELLKKQ